MRRSIHHLLFALILAGCGADGDADAGLTSDGGAGDGGDRDAAAVDAGPADMDAGGTDAGASDIDAGDVDAGDVDAGGTDAGDTDAGGMDAGGTDAGGMDAGFDAALPDAGYDASLPDAGYDANVRDAGPPPGATCLSGGTGTHVLRFRWAGSLGDPVAYVVYEANTLPDTTRWHVSAASRSIGYRPVFADPFLGEGGLDLSGTVFIDVELSTSGLSRVRNATLAIYGRSFNTTTSGSFEWMSFSGSGASPYAGVSNAAPYAWYGASATSALPAGDSGTLLRIEAGPPSNALVVNRVEICFDAD
ncbi:MAG: hypothetical protein H6719_04690 [Sandaracinaceae bacterium]|nr:hypothetical protein [Sandaracinaceae bacterium]